ncbi:ABC transporter permease [Aeromicrobium sp. HA]|uniref:ABC transporter permease n=1 Tax=Aeromicrobium sp. HA TaxID=3009077 RepID=UPI0022AE5F03|nr:ABC transporter permease [Aeromicrobium sp. HA]
MSQTLAGAPTLLRLAVRRDRWSIPAWLAVLTLMCGTSAVVTPGLYPTEADRVAAAAGLNASAGIVALYGPVLDPTSLGELAMTKMTVTYSVLVAVMTLFLVRRHTRSEEETGRAELLGGAGVGRLAPLVTALGFAAVVSALLGLLVAVTNALAGLPRTGSVAFGAAWAGTGLVGAAITAVCCQVSASARTCAGLAAAVLAVLFVARAAGDASGAEWLSWLSPFGWNTRLQAYGDTRWWVLGLYVALAVAAAAVAVALAARRDLGAGLLAPRPGPARGPGWLAGPLALGVRSHVAPLWGWTTAVALMGLLFGAISPNLDGILSDETERLLEGLGGTGALRDTMIASIASIAALIVCCFGITVLTHAADDERDGRTEMVLSTRVTRARAYWSVVTLALGGVTWLLLVAGLALALGVRQGTDHSPARIVEAALGQAPAAWVTVAVGVLLFAFRARWAVVGWGVLVAFGTLGQIGELLGLPDAALWLSPFTHVPHLPLEGADPVSTLALSGVAAALLGVGWWAYRGRDLA